ncbi:MAG: hypothetical protein VW405_11360 [Rhodospirillaceae bacterium]
MTQSSQSRRAAAYEHSTELAGGPDAPEKPHQWLSLSPHDTAAYKAANRRRAILRSRRRRQRRGAVAAG